MAEANRQLIEQEGKDTNYSVKRFKRESANTKPVTSIGVIAFINQIYAQLVDSKRIGNANVYRDLRNQLVGFIGKRDIEFEGINVSFCNRLEAHLRSKDCQETSISVFFRTLRATFNKAISEGIVKSDAYPFSRNRSELHKFSVSKFDLTTRKRAISREDINKIEHFDAFNQRLQLTKDVFLFSFYTGGINFVDIAQLRWKNIVSQSATSQRIIYTRQKTKGKFNVNLLPPAIEILNTYRSVGSVNPEEYIFPILRQNKHISHVQIENRLNKLNRNINKDLKQISSSLGIDPPLTTYVARHSFATILKKNGISISIISELMGHDSEQTTRIYLGGFDNEILDEAAKAIL